MQERSTLQVRPSPHACFARARETNPGAECYCGNSAPANTTLQPDSSCSSACSGNSSEACGGGNLLTVYYANQAPLPGPVTDPGPPGWTSFGCWTDQAPRTLSNEVQVPGGGSNLTVAACTSACGDAGYTLAGVEYGGKNETSSKLPPNGHRTKYWGRRMLLRQLCRFASLQRHVQRLWHGLQWYVISDRLPS